MRLLYWPLSWLLMPVIVALAFLFLPLIAAVLAAAFLAWGGYAIRLHFHPTNRVDRIAFTNWHWRGVIVKFGDWQIDIFWAPQWGWASLRQPIAACLIVAAAGALLAACQITIPAPGGGPPLVLTGNYNADLPSITAYRQILKTTVETDVTKLQTFFQASCPYVAAAQAQLPAAQTAAAQVMTSTAAAKQIANAGAALNVAQTVCNGGTASNLQGVFSAAVDAFQLVYGLVKNGN